MTNHKPPQKMFTTFCGGFAFVISQMKYENEFRLICENYASMFYEIKKPMENTPPAYNPGLTGLRDSGTAPTVVGTNVKLTKFHMIIVPRRVGRCNNSFLLVHNFLRTKNRKLWKHLRLLIPQR